MEGKWCLTARLAAERLADSMGSIDAGEVVEGAVSDVGAVVEEDRVVVVAVDMLREMVLGRIRDVRDLDKVN